MRKYGIEVFHRYISLCILVIILSCFIIAANGLSIAAGTTASKMSGDELRKILDSYDLEHLWQKGWRIDWHSGKGLWQWPEDGKIHTHCSAFVASVCAQLKVPMPIPINNDERGLANRQSKWLDSEEGKAAQWHRIDFKDAQSSADSGELVIASLFEMKGVGHIGIIRPLEKDRNSLFVVQAGNTNGKKVQVDKAFASHRGAVKNGLLKFYAHTVMIENKY
jgi:hypothetical protein